MLGGQKKTEAEYRAVKMESYSSLACFAKDRRAYLKKYVLGEKDEDLDDNKAVLIGNLAEVLIRLDKDEIFDKKFYLSICPEAPTELMLQFVNALYKHTELNTVDGVVTADFGDICKAAHADSGFKLKLEAVMGKFVGKTPELYYTQLRHSKPKNLIIVCQEDLENAEKVANELKTNPNTSWYVNLVSDTVRYEVIDQLQLEDFEVNGMIFKMMLDRLIVDHEEKTLQIIDWKVTWSVEDFVREYYLKRFGYIQAFLYPTGLQSKLKELGWEGYTILPPKFIVADSINYYDPLIYEVSEVDLLNAYNGFKIGGREYPGVESLINDLQWAKENTFRISRRNYLNNGVCQISEARK